MDVLADHTLRTSAGSTAWDAAGFHSMATSLCARNFAQFGLDDDGLAWNRLAKRSSGYGHHQRCGSSLGIFNFLLFLVFLLQLLQNAMINLVTNIMINGQNVSLLQAILLLFLGGLTNTTTTTTTTVVNNNTNNNNNDNNNNNNNNNTNMNGKRRRRRRRGRRRRRTAPGFQPAKSFDCISSTRLEISLFTTRLFRNFSLLKTMVDKLDTY